MLGTSTVVTETLQIAWTIVVDQARVPNGALHMRIASVTGRTVAFSAIRFGRLAQCSTSTDAGSRANVCKTERNERTNKRILFRESNTELTVTLLSDRIALVPHSTVIVVRANGQWRATARQAVRIAHQRHGTRTLVPAGQIGATRPGAAGQLLLQTFVDVCM